MGDNSTRVLKVQGGYNFRDLGGLKSKSGKTIKRDLLFRTDELGSLTAEDLNLLAKLNIQTVVDFRTDQERAQSLDKLPTTCKQEVHLDILSANMDAFVAEMKKGDGDFKKLMTGFYADMVLGQHAIIQYNKFFELVQVPSNTGIIYHCTAGKDRTGIATALILEALGVDRNQIMKDYLLSNEFMKIKYADYIQSNPKYTDLLLVHESYLEEAYKAIERKYTTVEDYLTSVLHVDLENMHEIYLES